MNATSKRVLAFLEDYFATHDTPPTNGEIAAALGVKWPCEISREMGVLRSWGYVEYPEGFRKSLRLRERD